MDKHLKWRIVIDEVTRPLEGPFPVRFIDIWQYVHGGPIFGLPYSVTTNMSFTSGSIASSLTSFGALVSSFSNYGQNPTGKHIDIEFDEPRPISALQWGFNNYAGNQNHLKAISVYYWDDDTSDWVLSWTCAHDLATITWELPLLFCAPPEEAYPTPVDLPLVVSSGTITAIYEPAAALIGGLPPADGVGVDEVENLVSHATTHSATQATAGNRPIFREEGINGKPYLELNGSKWMDLALTISGGFSAPPSINIVAGEFERNGSNDYSYVMGSPATNGGMARFGFDYRADPVRITSTKLQFVAGDASPIFDIYGASVSGSTIYAASQSSDSLAYGALSNSTNPVTTAITAGRLFAQGSGATATSGLVGDFYGFIRLDATWRAVDFGRAMAYARYRFLGEGSGPPPPPVINIPVLAGTLSLAGQTPGVLIDGGPVLPIAGTLTIDGASPSVIAVGFVEPQPETLTLSGAAPILFSGASVLGDMGELTIEGSEPAIYTIIGNFASQLAVLALAEPPTPTTLVSQSAVMAIAEPPAPPVAASQSAVMTIGEIIPVVHASQAAILILGFGEPCLTRRADCWIISRRDGVKMGFTSHDEAIHFGGIRCSPCKSLNPTATEQAAAIGDVANMDIDGLISDDRITEADLYGGLYDDAFVEVWRVSWDDSVIETPQRIAAGWCGEMSHGGASFRMEVFGPSIRLSQHAIVFPYAPGCGRDFGSSIDQLPPGGCGVDAEARKVGCVVERAVNRAEIICDRRVDPETAPMWDNGSLRFLTGANAGIRREVKTVDWETGRIMLQVPPPFMSEAGDQFDLLPGCDKRAETCKLYENYINYGGFPDVPGTDSIGETPDAKY